MKGSGHAEVHLGDIRSHSESKDTQGTYSQFPRKRMQSSSNNCNYSHALAETETLGKAKAWHNAKTRQQWGKGAPEWIDLQTLSVRLRARMRHPFHFFELAIFDLMVHFYTSRKSTAASTFM